MKATTILSLVVVVVCTIQAVYATSCIVQGGYDSTCPKTQPYCMATQKNIGDVVSLNCVECVSDCDCKLNEYCGKSAYMGTLGTCQKFSKAGKDCLPMSMANYYDVTVPDDVKCAMVVDADPLSYISGSTDIKTIDFQGVCIEQKCRMCQSVSGLYAPASCNGENLQSDRTCVFPGTYATVHSAPWASGEYFETPVNVWLAIFFTFGMISFFMSILTFFGQRFAP